MPFHPINNTSFHSRIREKSKPPSTDSTETTLDSDGGDHLESPDGKSYNPKRDQRRSHRTLSAASKIIPLKKRDGEPLWRVDLQYDFLTRIFQNDERVFTDTYSQTKEHTFREIYINAIAQSPKTSKVLGDKLNTEPVSAIHMAMVSLLVNVGRIDTTLNFFPEIRSRPQTYHSIPALQSFCENPDYKNLLAVSLLKGILEGACDDRSEPRSLEELAESKRTNPINLVFLLSSSASQLQDKYFVAPYKFHDLLMNQSLSSESRGRAFLWLMWTFLESDSSSDSPVKNPFGPGLNKGLCIPALKQLTPNLAERENIDTSVEKDFGYTMTKEHQSYIDGSTSAISSSVSVSNESFDSGGNVSDDKLHAKTLQSKEQDPNIHEDSTHESESEGDNTTSEKPHASPARLRLILKAPTRAGSRTKQEPNAIKTQATLREAKCQLEIQRMLKSKDRRRRRARYIKGPLAREWTKIKDIDPLYESDQDNCPPEGAKRRKKSDGSSLRIVDFIGDYGEESTAMATAFRRSCRWLKRWNSDKQLEFAVGP